MNEWKLNEKVLKEENIPEGAVGFIYKITRKSDKKIYIGKKSLSSSRKKKLTIKEKLLPENKRKTFKRTITDSNWRTYWGSCKELLEEIENTGEDKFTREIIEFCFTKTTLTYREVWHQFKYDVLSIDSYNGNILSRFFRKNVT